MALQVAERAVVGDELEAVVGALEGAAGPVPAVAPIADVGLQERDPSSCAEQSTRAGRLPLAAAQVRETGGDQDLLLAVGVEVEQRDLGLALAPRRRVGVELGPQARHHAAVRSRVDAR